MHKSDIFLDKFTVLTDTRSFYRNSPSSLTRNAINVSFQEICIAQKQNVKNCNSQVYQTKLLVLASFRSLIVVAAKAFKIFKQ